MATITCKDFMDRLDSCMGGNPPSDAEAHLRNCPDCSNLIEDLKAICSEASSWRADEIAVPPRIWVSLQSHLEQEGLIHENRPAEAAKSTWFRGWLAALPRPALAGAYLALLIAGAFALSHPINRQTNEAWLAASQDSTLPLRAQLIAEQDSFASFNNANPVVTASLNKNLAIVDNYIALCEKSVQEEPQNEVARDYLYEAYQQKADLLAQMTERGENNR
ncbi:MAG: hypothetical protein ABSB65_03235 [Candidatus Acidiferrales bacterium]|jgi:hypothetical protein